MISITNRQIASSALLATIGCEQECGVCAACLKAAAAERMLRGRIAYAVEKAREPQWGAFAPASGLWRESAGGHLERAPLGACPEDVSTAPAEGWQPSCERPEPLAPPVQVTPVSANLFHRVPPKALCLSWEGFRCHARIGQFVVTALNDSDALGVLRRTVIVRAWQDRKRGLRYYGERAGLRKAGVL